MKEDVTESQPTKPIDQGNRLCRALRLLFFSKKREGGILIKSLRPLPDSGLAVWNPSVRLRKGSTVGD
jgi:hypothetical protein